MTSQPVPARAGGLVALLRDWSGGVASATDWNAKAFLPLPASVNFKSKMKNHSLPIALPTSFHVFLVENLA